MGFGYGSLSALCRPITDYQDALRVLLCPIISENAALLSTSRSNKLRVRTVYLLGMSLSSPCGRDPKWITRYRIPLTRE
jgi:hypothetical protein